MSTRVKLRLPVSTEPRAPTMALVAITVPAVRATREPTARQRSMSVIQCLARTEELAQ